MELLIETGHLLAKDSSFFEAWRNDPPQLQLVVKQRDDRAAMDLRIKAGHFLATDSSFVMPGEMVGSTSRWARSWAELNFWRQNSMSVSSRLMRAFLAPRVFSMRSRSACNRAPKYLLSYTPTGYRVLPYQGTFSKSWILQGVLAVLMTAVYFLSSTQGWPPTKMKSQKGEVSAAFGDYARRVFIPETSPH